MKKLIYFLPLLIGGVSVLFFILYSRPYYLARYGLTASILIVVGSIVTIAMSIRGSTNHLPNNIGKWIASYLALVFIIASIYFTLLNHPYYGRVSTYDNPYILYDVKGALEYDEATIEARVNSMIGEKPPDLTFHLAENSKKCNLSDYQNNVILLNFWASWCFPCVSELPELDSLQLLYKQQGLVVITISGEARDSVINFVKANKLNTTVGYFEYDEVPILPYRALPLLPQSFVLDRKGNLREWFTGKKQFNFFEEMVKKYL